MIWVLIGHRGVGKTSLLKRLKGSIHAVFFDLDEEINKIRQEANKEFPTYIEEIFATKGESAFRELEKKTLKKILNVNLGLNSQHLIISVGAGFHLQDYRFPEGTFIIWIRRKTDSSGRIFLNRPRLNKYTNALNEYINLFHEREAQFKKSADWVYDMPEAIIIDRGEDKSEQSGNVIFLEEEKLDLVEKMIFSSLNGSPFNAPLMHEEAIHLNDKGIMTLSQDGKFYFANEIVEEIEIRSDFYSTNRVLELINFYQKIGKQILLSIRTDSFPLKQILNMLLMPISLDWALEHLSEKDDLCESHPMIKDLIFSKHEMDNGVEQGANFFFQEKQHLHLSNLNVLGPRAVFLKWSPEMSSFKEINIGIQWQNEDPQHRSFLPRSSDGRWYWVRLWLKGKQRINFIRNQFGLQEWKDQPSLYEWLKTPSQPKEIAAVLGSPIEHSYSPQFHGQYFLKWGIPFFAISLNGEQWEEGIRVLEDSFCLKYAAVTSPLKGKAFQLCQNKGKAFELCLNKEKNLQLCQKRNLSEIAEEFQSVNTLYKDKNGEWFGDNTDEDGLRTLINDVSSKESNQEWKQEPTLVWGGGGTLNILKKSFPEAYFLSVRSSLGLQAHEERFKQVAFRNFIWAAGDRDLPDYLKFSLGLLSSEFSNLSLIRMIDLSYQSNSKALLYAKEFGIKYFSGLEFFFQQAKKQKQLWESEKQK